MAITYKLFKLSEVTGVEHVIKKDDLGMEYTIPFDPSNTDYQEYLAWVADGNTADPAD